MCACRGHLVPPLQDVDAMLIHCQPQVLWQHCSVALYNVKDGGSIEAPLPYKAHEGLLSIAIIHAEVQEFSVLASDILWLHFSPHVARDVLLYDATAWMQHTSTAHGGRDNT